MNTEVRHTQRMAITGNQIVAARGLAGMTQSELAHEAGYSLTTIANIESADANPISAKTETLFAIQAALAARGVEFTNADRPGVRLRKSNPE